MSWHRDNADQLQRAADNLAGNGGVGSIEHYNLALGAQRSRDQAAWDEAGSAPPPILPYPGPSNIFSSPEAGAGNLGSSSARGGSSGAVFGTLFKALLISGAALASLALAAWAAESHWADGRPGGGLGRFAAAVVFHGESLSPASRYASAPDPGVHPAGGGPRLTGAQAYACQLDAACAEMPKADMLHAASMLAAATKAGDEAAARDLCLMPLLAGSRSDSIETARFYCAAALRNRPDSAEARRINSSLGTSPVVWAARLAQRVQSWATAR